VCDGSSSAARRRRPRFGMAAAGHCSWVPIVAPSSASPQSGAESPPGIRAATRAIGKGGYSRAVTHAIGKGGGSRAALAGHPGLPSFQDDAVPAFHDEEEAAL
jgi:hypothetical protein